MNAPVENDLLIRALRGEAVPRPPVWMMRQAGRYLPDFRALREKHSFWERAQTPRLAAAITAMPVDQIGVDAAILFSDILTVPLALGFHITLEPGEGPVVQDAVTSPERIAAIPEDVNIPAELHYVTDAIGESLQLLANRVPLLGFAGAPWTLFCYLVEGSGSKDFARAKAFAFQQPAATQRLLNLLTDATIAYLNAQIAAGVHAVQVFDSHAGVLGPEDFARFAFPSLQRIAKAVSGAPVILFARGAHYALADLAGTGAAALGLDWTLLPHVARQQAGPRITLQGNLDPSFLLASPREIHARTQAMLRAFGIQRYIANLGHGILPNIPVENARAFVQAVQAFEA